MYMTLSWTHDLAEHMTTGGAQSGSVTLFLNELQDKSNERVMGGVHVASQWAHLVFFIPIQHKSGSSP